MTTIAFIGLGIMGAPMARHLVDAGHEVFGVNRGGTAVNRLVEAGAGTFPLRMRLDAPEAAGYPGGTTT